MVSTAIDTTILGHPFQLPSPGPWIQFRVAIEARCTEKIEATWIVVLVTMFSNVGHFPATYLSVGDDGGTGK